MKNRLLTIILVAMAAAFVAGVFHLLALRLDVGDVYSPYSSQRSDPLGTMALHDALATMPGLKVRRDFAATDKLPSGQNMTYLHLGASAFFWTFLNEDTMREAERFAESGGRLVILLKPENSRPRSLAREMRRQERDEKEAKKQKEPGKKKKKAAVPVSGLKERWKFGFDYVPLPTVADESFGPALVKSSGLPGLPRTLEWHSGAVITNLSAAWTPVYWRGTNVVMAELRRGKGSIVIGTDSYHVSNEALAELPQPALLAWLAGSNTEIVFDEAHLGTVEATGVAVLMRKYRMGGFIGAFLLVAILFVWKASSRFVPLPPPKQDGNEVQGKSASSGFINLLRRNLPLRDVPRECLEQWKHAFLREGRAADKAAAAEVIMRHSKDAPVALYNELCGILKTRTNNPRK